jgi:hypothetical protein
MRFDVPAHIGHSNADPRDDPDTRQRVTAELVAHLNNERRDDPLMGADRRVHLDDLPVLVKFAPIGQPGRAQEQPPALGERWRGERL